MSSFSADEVELMRERGNAYCAKVWLGLYDGKTIGNDAESIKDFIMQKYEKKRYVAKKQFLIHRLKKALYKCYISYCFDVLLQVLRRSKYNSPFFG